MTNRSYNLSWIKHNIYVLVNKLQGESYNYLKIYFNKEGTDADITSTINNTRAESASRSVIFPLMTNVSACV